MMAQFAMSRLFRQSTTSPVRQSILRPTPQSKNKKTRLIGILGLDEKKDSLLSATRTGNWRLGGDKGLDRL
jgi:hypothetical protein